MPDDIADAWFDLDDRDRGHIDCRVKGCDMPFRRSPRLGAT
jgi:hypothetical protein